MAEQNYEQLVARLRAHPYESMVISQHRSVPEVVSAFILHKAGVLASQGHLYNPEVWFNSRMNAGIKDNTLLLFDQDIQNPKLLAALVLTSDIKNYHSRTDLLDLANFCQYYREFPGLRWREARGNIERRVRSMLSLHDYLSLIMDANYNNPVEAFNRCVDALERLYNQPEGIDLAIFSPVGVDIPILKSKPEESDRFDHKEFTFDRMRVAYLVDARYPIVIGGAPNSGKSTLAASLFIAMSELIAECEKDGILGEGEVKIGLCDLDKVSPTSRSISLGIAPRRDSLRGELKPWMAQRAGEELAEMNKYFNIVLGDLPGGITDITRSLARYARFSILLNRESSSEDEDWLEFFAEFGRQDNLVRVRTVKDEKRQSALVKYDSLYRGGRLNLLFGRVANLDRTLMSDDPFIQFIAHTLLFDYLPGITFGDYIHHYGIHQSLSPRLYLKPPSLAGSASI